MTNGKADGQGSFELISLVVGAAQAKRRSQAVRDVAIVQSTNGG
jgi:hypothetical protein